ncbi:MAG: hypothetical protein NT135_00215 [Candidatus Berkelbacteria bacterium]|nr:hypothetical protein [Candidatus Berkelbacteria bacterium]
MIYKFYNSKVYRQKQSKIAKRNWKKGIYSFLYKKVKKHCKRDDCNNTFFTTRLEPKKYCSRKCAATVNNLKRKPLLREIRAKISRSLKGRINPQKGVLKIHREERKCQNPSCSKVFKTLPSSLRKYCSVPCSISVIGSNPTSPRASKGKGGIRYDIDPKIYFYSRWEANLARVYNYLDIKWISQPKIFDLGTQRYTPDFYLPEYNAYIEVKNFLSSYSKMRDRLFRKKYPNIKLTLIGKKQYNTLKRIYAPQIKNWEYG